MFALFIYCLSRCARIVLIIKRVIRETEVGVLSMEPMLFCKESIPTICVTVLVLIALALEVTFTRTELLLKFVVKYANVYAIIFFLCLTFNLP